MNHYQLGSHEALQDLGLDADHFAQFAANDATDEVNPSANRNPEFAKGVDKSPTWSGANSLEAGDVGTRNHQMGLPRSGAV